MSAPPFMPFYVADYLSDTRHLTTEEHGAYLLLLMAMWRAGGRLPNEGAKLARIAGLTSAKWAKLETDILAFFDVLGDEIGHRRIEKEFEKYSRTSAVRSEMGARGAKAKSLKKHDTALAIASDLPEQNASKPQAYQISDIRTEEMDANASLSPEGDGKGKYPDVFEACWKAYPHIKGRSSKTKAFGCWRRIPAETRTRLLAAIQRFSREDRTVKAECGAKGMHLWLRDELYRDWLDDGQDGSTPARIFDGPAEIRAAVVAARGEDFTRSWLDRCDWDEPSRAVVSANGFVVDRLRQEIGTNLSPFGVRILRSAA